MTARSVCQLVGLRGRNTIEELRRGAAECPREADDVHQRNVPLATLDPADIRPVHAGKLGKTLLGKPQLCPYRLHAGSKCASSVCHFTHEADDLMTMVLQPISSTLAQPPEEITVG